MSNHIDPVKGLCRLCDTISVPYPEPGTTNLDVEEVDCGSTSSQPSNASACESRIWLFEHGTVSYVHQSARNGCAFCNLIVRRLHLMRFSTEDQETTQILLKTEGACLVPSLARLDGEALVRNTSIQFLLSSWTPAMDDCAWVGNDTSYFKSVLTRHDAPKESDQTKLQPSTIFNACLRRCINSHTCGSQQQALLPARVVDVGTERQDVLKLCEPSSGTHGKYAALTYCWGQSNLFVATSANIELLHGGFTMDVLPRTVRDAVKLTRQLGLRYLWIDALCIIQGDDAMARADWALQVGRMESVYRNALVTISAAGASNSNCGLYSQHQCLLRRSGGGYLSVTSQDKVRTFVNEPINRRAWTLQEHLLSPRLLIFASFGLIWQCNEASIGPRPSRDFVVPFTTLFSYRLPDPPAIFDWQKIVENFCIRDLTKPDDKFHAIAALARKYSAVTNDSYVAGLWESQLRQHLLWENGSWTFRTHRDPASIRRSEQYRAPSWSWASLAGPVRYRIDSRSFGRPDTDDGWLAEVRARVELVDAGDRFGAVKAGWLTLHGPLVESRIQWPADLVHGVPYLETLNGVRLGHLMLDDVQQALKDLADGSTVWCLALRAKHECNAIAMLKGERDPVQYTRIGLARSDSNDELMEALQAAPTETVVVV